MFRRWWLYLCCWLIVVAVPVFAQQPPSDLFIEATVSDNRPYVGQQIVYSFLFFDSIGVSNALYDSPDFEGFWRVDLNWSQQFSRLIDQKRYTITSLPTAIFPTRTGRQSIQGASVVLPQTVFESERVLDAPPVFLDVQALPSDPPSDFYGAVGQFSLTFDFVNSQTQFGDPLTAQLVLMGNGQIEAIPMPRTEGGEGWSWEVINETYQAHEQDGLVIGTKVFDLVFFADMVGLIELPRFVFTYFDPQKAQYALLQSEVYSISVVAPEWSDPVATPVPPLPGETEFLPSLRPISSSSPVAAPSFFLWFFIPVVLVAGGLFRLRKRQLARNSLVRRQRVAIKNAQRRLTHARHLDPESALREIRRTILMYGVDAGMYPDWPAGIDETDPVALCMMEIDAALYAPAVSVDLPSLLNRVQRALLAQHSEPRSS